MTQGKDATQFTKKFVIPFISKHAPTLACQANALNQAILQCKNDCPHCNKPFHGNAKKFAKCQVCQMSVHFPVEMNAMSLPLIPLTLPLSPNLRTKCLIPNISANYPLHNTLILPTRG